MRSLSDALGIPLETLLAQVGVTPASDDGAAPAPGAVTEAAIRADPILRDAQKEALLAVYRSYVAEARERDSA